MRLPRWLAPSTCRPEHRRRACWPGYRPQTGKWKSRRHPRRRFSDGDPFLNFIDLEPCLGQLANWAALLPRGDAQRRAILTVLSLEYARLGESGVATPSLVYHGAVLAVLEGDRETAIAELSRAIDEGFRDEPALRRDLAWRALADDADFRHQLQRLDAQLAIERALPDPPPAR